MTDWTHIQKEAHKLMQEASVAHASEVKISINKNHHTKVFFRQGDDGSSLRYEHTNDYGKNLCATIYQGLTDESDPCFVPDRPQTGAIKRKENLPDGVSYVTVNTYPGITGYDMILRMWYEGEIQAQHDDLATTLAIKAIKELDESMFIVFADLDVSRPETLQNFERFKSVLMMAYLEGQKNPLPMPQ